MKKEIKTLLLAMACMASTTTYADLTKVDGLSALRNITLAGTGYGNGVDVQLTTSYLSIKAFGASSQLVPVDPTHPITSTTFMAVRDRISNNGSIIIDPELCDALLETMQAAMETAKANYDGYYQRDFTFGEGSSFTKATFPCRYYINANGMPMLGIAESEYLTAENTSFVAQSTFSNTPDSFTPQMITRTDSTQYNLGNDPDKYLGRYISLYNPNPDSDISGNVSMVMTGSNADDNMNATVNFIIDEFDALIDAKGNVIQILHDEKIPVSNTVNVKDVFHYYSDDLKPTSTMNITGIFAKEADASSDTGYSYVIYLYGSEPIEGYKTTTAIQQVDDTEAADTETFYNMAGQRVNSPAKGVFIHKGKKVTVK